jgi:ribose 5-phosphate isomerase B
MIRVAVGADHAGFRYKEYLVDLLRQRGYQVTDMGTDGPQSVDYPDYARAVAEAVARGEVERGLLVCGSSVGVCIVANKVPGVRAGSCQTVYAARQAVEHDDMNVLCLGERVIGIEVARTVTEAFMEARFSDEERHRRRLNKLLAVERDYLSSGTED